ncbi:MAG: DUF2127 domain-containing protein [Candidatus Acidiferrales bacterium]
MIPHSLLHGTFRVGIAIKAIDGILETIGGTLLWFVMPAAMNRALRFIFQHELSRDTHDFFATHLPHFSASVAHGSIVFASLYLLSHGVVKIVLAAALWMNELWAYPLAIFVFGAFTVYQIYRYAHTHSLALLILTVFDAAVVWLTWEEYGAQMSARKSKAGI